LNIDTYVFIRPLLDSSVLANVHFMLKQALANWH
jgi:hypothetical protein